MSGSSGESSGPVGRREVAVRCFAAEYDDASLEFSESDEERAPNYVVTPTGARVNRLFAVGVLTEVEQVSDDVLRGRVVDPTGAFVVYAGQYQPDAKTALERLEPPTFVAVTGKARTFEPDDGDRVYTSIRPESVNEVDADTRDRWTVQAAEQTVDRVATMAAALEREERGAALTEVLAESGVDPALASGVPRAIAHYDTTSAYLDAVRTMALQAAEVVAGERDEVEPLAVTPDEGGPVEADLAAGVELVATAAGGADTAEATGAVESEPASEPPTAVEGDDEAEAPVETGATDGEEVAASTTEPSAEEPAVEEGGATAAEDASADDDDELGDFDVDVGGTVDASPDEPATADESDASVEEAAPSGAEAGTDDMYELDEEEVEAVEEEYGTEFSTGNEVGDAGEADIETPEPDDAATDGELADESEPEAETPADEEAGTDDDSGADEPTPDAPEIDEAESETESDAEEAAPADDAGEVDLVDATVAAMEALDEGDGAERSAVVDAVASEHGVDEAAVEDAIGEALMGGRCYEPDDEHLKAI